MKGDLHYEEIKADIPKKSPFQLRVRINKEKAKDYLFPKLPGKFVTSSMLQFVGRRDEVCQILQVLNHTGRAFCVSSNGLKGSLAGYPKQFWSLSEEAREVHRMI